jgi:hypothetical protein
LNLDSFIARWANLEGGAERANYALFLTELCDVIDVPRPDPASAVTEKNDYVFERFVRRRDNTTGRIDLYRRDAFVLEAKQSRQIAGSDKFVHGEQGELLTSVEPVAATPKRGRRGFDVLMVNARRQAEDYARELPQDHGWPPFVIVCDVGYCLETYADFRCMGKYEQFPDRQGYRIFLEDLRKPEVRERLRRIWLEPQSLDPSKRAARATREIAKRLAEVSKRLEGKHNPEEVAHFLMRCLFTMFAEDTGLLPERAFLNLLEECTEHPEGFAPLLDDLWKKMDTGGYSTAIRAAVRRFNGSLFKDARVIPLGREEIGELRAAAAQDWREVEPAIFGTLLEQALDPEERKRLGAHYTPRAYVERLVAATVIEPLRDDWTAVVNAVEEARASGDEARAVKLVSAFHDKLCATRVLDPACGTGNFLYVSLDLMKRLEGEVLELLADLGGQEALSGLEGHTIDPHQFLGLELNPRAAAIAELVLWIGYLQLHFKTRGSAPGDPILKAFGNINFGKPGGYDAVLTWNGYPLPSVVRDGGETKETYPGARRPPWPMAEFIVGNPPFIGGKDVRARLGGGYAEALWKATKGVAGSADFVMFWWDRAAEILTQKGSVLRRFGFVTTNSITQEFSRRVIKKRMEAKSPISLIYAIPDHPWTKAGADTAAVRIAMTVAERGVAEGLLREVGRETALDTDEPQIAFLERRGRINSDLSVGTDVTNAHPLRSNEGLCSPGVKLHGAGFIVTPNEAEHLGLGRRHGLEQYIRPYRNGRDLMGRSRDVMVIDLFGLSAEQVRDSFPEVYQHIKSEVKEKILTKLNGKVEKVGRDWNNRVSYKDNWWIFGEPRSELRPALDGLSRYIATVETAKHRVFEYLNATTTPDNKLVCIADADSWVFAVLSSCVHVQWSLRAGGWLGVGNDSVYVKTKVFDPFPFPSPTDELKEKLRAAGERLDAFRKARLAEHPNLTMTGLYNVREAIRSGRDLTPDETRIKDEGLVLILNELHDEIDDVTLQAYGWPAGMSDEEVVTRLVALNKARAAEEKRGVIRWLRRDYQKARAGVIAEGGVQTEADLVAPAETQRPSFPRDPVEQSAAILSALTSSLQPLSPAEIAGRWRKDKRTEAKIAAYLAVYARTGTAFTPDGGKTYGVRRAA